MELRGIQHIGTRENQQDSYFLCCGQTDDEEFTVAGVADGVGGLEGGGYAAYVTAQFYARMLAAFASGYEFTMRRFHAYCEKARRRATHELRGTARRKPKFASAATTISAFAIVLDRVYIMNIGDTPVIVGNNKGARVVSCEHSRAAQLVATGVLTPDEYKDSPFRGTLAKFVSTNDATSNGAHYACVDLSALDRVIVCSDGALEAIGNAGITHACGHPWIDAAVHKLDLAMKTFATDNATLVIAGNDDNRALDLTFDGWEA